MRSPEMKKMFWSSTLVWCDAMAHKFRPLGPHLVPFESLFVDEPLPSVGRTNDEGVGLIRESWRGSGRAGRQV